jgi:hypothetical protein
VICGKELITCSVTRYPFTNNRAYEPVLISENRNVATLSQQVFVAAALKKSVIRLGEYYLSNYSLVCMMLQVEGHNQMELTPKLCSNRTLVALNYICKNLYSVFRLMSVLRSAWYTGGRWANQSLENEQPKNTPTRCR